MVRVIGVKRYDFEASIIKSSEKFTLENFNPWWITEFKEHFSKEGDDPSILRECVNWAQSPVFSEGDLNLGRRVFPSQSLQSSFNVELIFMAIDAEVRSTKFPCDINENWMKIDCSSSWTAVCQIFQLKNLIKRSGSSTLAQWCNIRNK